MSPMCGTGSPFSGKIIAATSACVVAVPFPLVLEMPPEPSSNELFLGISVSVELVPKVHMKMTQYCRHQQAPKLKLD